MDDYTERLLARLEGIPPLGEASATQRFIMHLAASTDEFIAERIRENDGASLREAGFTSVADELNL